MLVLTNLVHSLQVMSHGLKRVTRVITTLDSAAVHRPLVVNLGVLLEILLVLESDGKIKKKKTLFYDCESNTDMEEKTYLSISA